MSTPAELDWRCDLVESFDFIGRIAAAHTMPLLAYLALGVFAGLVPGAAFFASMASIVVYVALASWLINMVWKECGSEQEKKGQAFRHTSPPLLSLVFLEALFYGTGGVLTLLLIIPGIWWSLASSLAIVFVCIEDRGAIDALKQSHRMLTGNYRAALRYLFPNVVLVGLGILAFRMLIKMLADHAGENIPSEALNAAFNAGLWFLIYGGNLVARMILLVCQTKLYLQLNFSDAAMSSS